MKRYPWLLPILLLGCAPMRPAIVGPKVDLVIYPRFHQKSQALLPANTLSSIATLDIVPYLEDSGVFWPISPTTGSTTSLGASEVLKLSQSTPSIDPARPFVLRGLKPNKNYRIYGKAYNQANVQISQDSQSYVELVVENNDAPAMTTVPVQLLPVPFAAAASVSVQTLGRYEYLTAKLYQNPGNVLLSQQRTTRFNPDLLFSNLQGDTDYLVVLEAYKFGSLFATGSLNLNVGQDTSPATKSMSLTIPYVVTTIAGSAPGFLDGVGTQAKFQNPRGIALDAWGNLFISDINNFAIRKLTPNRTVVTWAGNGASGVVDGIGTQASMFTCPEDVAVDDAGNLYVADYWSFRVRKVSPGQAVTTFVGGTQGFLDGQGTGARINSSVGLTSDSAGTVYLADTNNHSIRKISPTGAVTTLAGNGVSGFKDDAGTLAQFSTPYDVALDRQGNLYVADYNNHRIRKITPNGAVTTLAGNGTAGWQDGTGTLAKMNSPHGLVLDPQGNVYFGDYFNNRVRMITPQGVVLTLAGTGAAETADGTGTMARFNAPAGVAVAPNGVLFVTDFAGHRIRKME